MSIVGPKQIFPSFFTIRSNVSSSVKAGVDNQIHACFHGIICTAKTVRPEMNLSHFTLIHNRLYLFHARF